MPAPYQPPSITLLSVFTAVLAERRRQDEAEGQLDLPDGTGGGGRETWRTLASNSRERAAREGRLTFLHILDEAATAALAETDENKLEVVLVQAAAVCVQWVEAIQRRRQKSGDVAL